MELTGDENEIQQQIEQRITELPQDVQNAILSSEFGDKVLSIGSAAKLHLDQIQSLNDSTMFFMLGFTSEAEYQKEVRGMVGNDEAVAQKIVTSVNQQILLPIRESLKGFAAKQASPLPPTPPPSRPSLAEVLPKGNAQPAVAPVASAPLAPPVPQMKPSPTTAPAPEAPLPMIPQVDMHPADIALTQKTVVTPANAPAAPASTAPQAASKTTDAKAVPPKPQDYKADPYREPIS